MLFSTNLLKRYISLNIEPKDLMSNMTLHACEVEQILERKLPELLVIGYVTETQKHPNADTLIVCQVNCGKHGNYQICTAADNIAPEMYVPVALPGCYLPAIDLTIGERKMRGEDSNGMICAKIELGINEDADLHGIWILTEDFDDLTQDDLGIPLAKKYEWLNNTILDVDNKTINNRPDLTGLLGMAIEMKAIFTYLARDGKANHIKQQNITHELDQHYPGRVLEILEHAHSPRQKVEVQTKDCSVYSLVQLDGISVRPTPFYDRLALIDSGLQSKNNRVDFSNLFMTFVGQPIHIFDADKIKGTIVVRNALEGEKMMDLTGIEHSLVSQDIVIADESGVIALAGVIGGISTAVSDTTKNIVIEIAHFDPVATRKASMRIGVRTDAVMRYEKTLSPLLSLTSLSLLLDSIKQYKSLLGDYNIVGASTFMEESVQSYASAGQYISFDAAECIKIIFGRDIEPGDTEMIEEILELLGYSREKNGKVRIPRWRGSDDMNIAHDLYEEVVRIYGYNRIVPLSDKQVSSYKPFYDIVRLQRIAEQVFVHTYRADQLQTYPWCDESLFSLLGYSLHTLVKLRNAVAPELSYLRPSIIPNLLQAVTKNSKMYDEFTLFDSGQTWNKEEKFSRFLNKQSFETTKLGLVSYKKAQPHWVDDGILAMKDMIETYVRMSGLQGEVVYDATNSIPYHPKKQGKIIYLYNNVSTEIGFLGQLHPMVLEGLKIDKKSQIVVGELFLETLSELYKSQGHNFQSGSAYYTIQDQILVRDLSFVIDKQQPFGTILDVIKKIDGVQEVAIFDLYQGEQLPEGKKSLALSLTILGDGSWTSDQINKILEQAVIEAKKVGAELRS